jgi:hypothetical protein
MLGHLTVKRLSLLLAVAVELGGALRQTHADQLADATIERGLRRELY